MNTESKQICKELTDKINEGIISSERELIKAFDKFMEKHKYTLSLCPHYAIAKHCLEIENKKYGRIDKLSIKSEPRVIIK